MRLDLKTAAERQSNFCKVFSNPKRILIIHLLKDQEKSVSEIADAIASSLQSTSQHLKAMKSNGILESHREGQTVFYRIADNVMPETGIQPCEILNNT